MFITLTPTAESAQRTRLDRSVSSESALRLRITVQPVRIGNRFTVFSNVLEAKLSTFVGH